MRIATLKTFAFSLWLAAPLAHAADADKLHGFGLAESAATPAYGRVLIVFLLVAGLAWGGVWLMRRYGLRGPLRALGVPGTPQQLRQIGRTSLPGGIACHVIETQGKTVLITVTRNGVTSLVLGDAASPATSGAPAP
jgi:hypothetical protein